MTYARIAAPYVRTQPHTTTLRHAASDVGKPENPQSFQDDRAHNILIYLFPISLTDNGIY
jgi:hypothetical protein